MTTADHPAAAHEEAHGPDHVHDYDFGVSEGNARVPRWLLAVMIALFGFFAYYVVTQWDAQPSSARAK